MGDIAKFRVGDLKSKARFLSWYPFRGALKSAGTWRLDGSSGAVCVFRLAHTSLAHPSTSNCLKSKLVKGSLSVPLKGEVVAKPTPVLGPFDLFNYEAGLVLDQSVSQKRAFLKRQDNQEHVCLTPSK